MADQSPAAHAQPFQTPVARLAREGLQLSKSLDELSMLEVSRIANLYQTTGDLQSRLGQTSLATAGASIHSIKRMNDPRLSTYTRFWGAGSSWYRGQSGVLSALDAGFSGNPLSLVTVRPAFSGEPWTAVADTLQMRKARSTGASLPLGLPAPGPPTVVVNTGRFRGICGFDAADGTAAATWTPIGGLANPPTAIYTATPVLSDIPGVNGNGVNMATQVDPAIIKTGYWSVMALDHPLDLSIFDDTTATSDEDIIHLALRIDNPSGVEEVRLYLVCSPFSTGTTSPAVPLVPGTIPYANLAAYVHTYRPSDYAAFIGQLDPAVAAQQAVRATDLLQGFGPSITVENLPGANVWTEFGIVGLPVRRGDFLPVGSAGQPGAGTDWSTITGLYIVVVTSAPVSVNVAFDDLYVTGGYGPDTSEPGSQKLDYRMVNYDPRTGARSNGSTTLAESLWVDALRQSITVTPTGIPGDPDLRQELYRRGESMTDNWRFVARNSANGGAITDTLTTAAVLVTDVIPVDHFQPVATTDSAGATVLAQPLPVLFGPFDDGTVCGLGDPYRPGHLYACLPGEIDHWPSTGAYAVEVCSPAEELMNGCVVGGAGFVLSRERGYTVHTNLAGGAGIVVTPTSCLPGLAARWGFCVGPGGIFYVARDDIRVTSGGDSVVLSDALWPLFHGQGVNGYAPINFGVPAAIRLAVHDMDLYFTYKDTNGDLQCLIFSLVFRYWRAYSWAHPVNLFYSDETQGEAQYAQGALQLLMGCANGTAYTYGGYTDDGTPISWSVRTGAWNWNQPREEKLLGDLIVEGDFNGTQLSAQVYLNLETVTNTAQTVTSLAGYKRYTFDPFGIQPQHARSVSINLSGTAPAANAIKILWAGIAYATQPEITMNRATTWEPLNEGRGEAYLTGCSIDSDTGGSPRSILVEGLLNGAPVAITTLTVNSNAGRRQWFSWAAVHVDMVRLRPTGACEPWMLFGCDWLYTPGTASHRHLGLGLRDLGGYLLHGARPRSGHLQPAQDDGGHRGRDPRGRLPLRGAGRRALLSPLHLHARARAHLPVLHDRRQPGPLVLPQVAGRDRARGTVQLERALHGLQLALGQVPQGVHPGSGHLQPGQDRERRGGWRRGGDGHPRDAQRADREELHLPAGPGAGVPHHPDRHGPVAAVHPPADLR